MGWLFGQVWVLCAVAFLAGAGVTWLVFVRPRGSARPPRYGSGPVGTAPWADHPWAGRAAEPAPVEKPPLGPPVDPALAALDSRDTGGGRRPPRTAAAAATGALDLLGVASTSPSTDAGPQTPPRTGRSTRPGSDDAMVPGPADGPGGRAHPPATARDGAGPNIPAQGRPVEVPPEIPAQARPTDPAPGEG